jgi:hypothetical protein
LPLKRRGSGCRPDRRGQPGEPDRFGRADGRCRYLAGDAHFLRRLDRRRTAGTFHELLQFFQSVEDLLLLRFEATHIFLELVQLPLLGSDGLRRRGETQTPINQQGATDHRTPEAALILRTQWIPHCSLAPRKNRRALYPASQRATFAT